MKRLFSILPAVIVTLLLFTACNNSDNKIYFNKSNEYINSGARLVEPVVVDENDFLTKYNINVAGLTTDTNYNIRYRLDYKLDKEAIKADLTALINSVVTITENDKVIFVMYISDTEPIAQYVIDSDNTKTSLINGIETRLFDLSNNETDLFYGEFELNGYYITCSMYDKTENDMIDFLTKLSSDNLLAETE